MARVLVCLIALVGVVLPSTLAQAGDQRPIVVVFNIEAKRVKLGRILRDALTDHLSNQLAQKGYYQIVPRSVLKKQLVRQKRKSYKECYDESCQIEIGKELAAEKTIAAQVLKLGRKCTVNLTLYDLKKAATETAASARGGCGEDGLVESIEKAVDELTGASERAEAVKRSEEEARRKAEAKERERLARVEAERKADEENERKKREVKQPGTNLYWLRCPIGQRSTGTSCKGKARKMDWHEAMNACPSGYRLPSIQEFMSMLGGCYTVSFGGRFDRCNECANSSTCSSMFGEDTGWYWSSTSFASRPDLAFYVDFDDDDINSGADKDSDYVLDLFTVVDLNVRCVRSGP